jgi:glycosyltransferase involved in cell wall biosynthesis
MAAWLCPCLPPSYRSVPIPSGSPSRRPALVAHLVGTAHPSLIRLPWQEEDAPQWQDMLRHGIITPRARCVPRLPANIQPSERRESGVTVNVLFITAYNGIGGGEAMQLNIMRALDRRQYCVHLLTPQRGAFQEAADAAAVTTHSIRYRGTTTAFIPGLWSRFPIVGQLRTLLDQENIRVIVSDYHSLPFIIPAAQPLQIPVIWLTIGWWFPIHFWQRNFFQHRIQRIVAVSSAIKERLLGNPPVIPPDRIEVILPGIDPDLYHPGIDGSSIRARLGIGPETPLVALVARFQNVKGHEYFLEAARYILEAVPEAHFAVAGEDVFDVAGDRAYKRRILQMAQSDSRLRERVTYLGFVPGAREVYAAADVLVCSSWFESLGMAALESMSMQRPIVSTNVGGPLETIVDGVTGFLVPPHDGKAIAEQVIKLLKNPGLRQQMGAAGRARVLERFTADRFTASVGAVINEVAQTFPSMT